MKTARHRSIRDGLSTYPVGIPGEIELNFQPGRLEIAWFARRVKVPMNGDRSIIAETRELLVAGGAVRARGTSRRRNFCWKWERLVFRSGTAKGAKKSASSMTIIRFRRLNSTGGEQSIPARLIAPMNVEPKWIS